MTTPLEDRAARLLDVPVRCKDNLCPSCQWLADYAAERAKGGTGDDSIRRRQDRQPWTVPYSHGVEDARKNGVGHIIGSHVALHVAKTAGKLAAVFERMDHPLRGVAGPGWGPSTPYDDDAQTLKDMAADLLVAALRVANLYGFDLADEHARRVIEKNGVLESTTAIAARAERGK